MMNCLSTGNSFVEKSQRIHRKLLISMHMYLKVIQKKNRKNKNSCFKLINDNRDITQHGTGQLEANQIQSSNQNSSELYDDYQDYSL